MAAITPDQFHSVDFVPSRNPGCIEVHDDRLSANPRRSVDDEIPRRLTASRGTFPKRDLLAIHDRGDLADGTGVVGLAHAHLGFGVGAGNLG